MAEEGLVRDLVDEIDKVIESMTGASPQPTIQAGTVSGETEVLWWKQPFNYGPDSTAWIGAPEVSWKEIGGRVLAAAGIEDGTPEDLKSTYQEVLNQSLSGLAQCLSKQARRDIECQAGTNASPGPGMADVFTVSLRLGGEIFPLLLAFSAGFPQGAETEDAKSAPLQLQGVIDQNSPPAPGNEKSIPKTLDLLLDVELPVSISFGRAQLPLKDVIKLTTGSIVELNRAVSEPVEIIVNNCVIARGQVVVVEGNFGVRIQQIISRMERLRTLK